MGNVADEAVKAEKNGAWVKKTQVIDEEHLKEGERRPPRDWGAQGPPPDIT